MKPLNLDNRPCSPISSNCVVWQGPTLKCIDLCTGDTISDVVAKLAEELCTLLDQTNVTNYDLTCLGITACGPNDIQALIQLLIDKICELENVPVDNTVKGNGGCPDCPVTIAECLRTGNNTTMQLLDYVQLIAAKVCSLIDSIGNINTQITNLDDRVTILENTPPPSFTLPSFIIDCTLANGTVVGGNAYPIDTILNALINDDIHGYCALTGVLGTPAELSSAVGSACITSSTPTASNPPVPFGTEYSGSWVNSPTTVADTINNIWIALCDIYKTVEGVSLSVQDTNSIDLDLTSGVITANIVDTGWKDLEGFAFYTGTMATNKPQCRRIGNQIHFRGVVTIPINNGSGAAQPLTAENAYNNVYRATPFVGTGGVIYDAQNRILFNSSGIAAQSVIPTSVLDAGTNLDNTYQAPQLVGLRKLLVEQELGNGQTGAVLLTAAVNVVILPNKTLRLSPLATIEQSTGDLTSFEGASLLRNLTSSFTPRSRVINFKNYTPSYDGNMSINQAPLNGVFVASLTVGQLYRIKSYTAGDDFTNVGAAVNATGESFIATGGIPTTWTTSEIIPITSALHSDGFNNTLGGSQWPAFADLTTGQFDAGRATNLGGFVVELDGLIAYLDPCNTDIKSYSCGKGVL